MLSRRFARFALERLRRPAPGYAKVPRALGRIRQVNLKNPFSLLLVNSVTVISR